MRNKNFNFRRSLITIWILISIIAEVYNQNQVSGLISASIVWETEMTPIHVIGNVTIPDSITLTIEPGVEVIFQGNYNISVYGNLIAQGTQTDSIIFTKSDAISSWQGIDINTADVANDSTLLKYVRVEHANDAGINVNRTNKFGISNCLITKNTGTYGTGMIINRSNVVIENNTFLENAGSVDWSTALYCIYATVTMKNNLFIKNSSSGLYGGALSSVGTTFKIINNTFVSNSGKYGGAIFFESSNSTLINNVFWNNYATNAGNDIFFHSGTTGYLNSNALRSSGMSSSGSTINYEGGSFGATCINLSSGNTDENGPNFTDPDSDDYSLTWQSPLVNKGDTTGVSDIIPATDHRGQERIQRGIIDIGAYESPYIFIELIGNSDENGSVSPARIRVEENGSQIFTIKPNTGYSLDSATFAGLDVLGDIVASSDSFLFTVNNVVKSDTLYIGFAINNYNMRSIADGNGNITPDSAIVEHGSEFIYTIVPNEGYEIESASIAGQSVLDDLIELNDTFTYKISSVEQADTLRVNFTLINYTLESIAGENGSVTPALISVNYNESVTYTITPDPGYEIATADINMVDLKDSVKFSGSNYTLKIDSIQSDGILSVTFQPTLVNLTPYTYTSELKIFPNPTSGKIFVEGNIIDSIEILNMVGQLNKQVFTNNSKKEIDLTGFPKGIYLIKVKTNIGIKSQKLIIK